MRKRVVAVVLAALLSPALALAAGETATRRRVDLRHLRRGASAILARDTASNTWVATTLDPALQGEVERALAAARPKEGAVVVSDIRTGRVLAWSSFGGARDVVSTPIAPSASVFKVVTAAALLESGRAHPSTKQCWSGGERRIEADDLDDDRATDDRCTTLGDALGHSVNLVFARLALKHLSPTALRDEAAELGIGSEIPIDVRVPESTLTVPEDRLGFARAAAGFWNGKLSPLSALFAMQTIARGGERMPLSVLRTDEAETPAGRALTTTTARELTRMLEVTTRSGTSAKVFHRDDGSGVFPRVRVAGKTGTLIGGHPRRMYSWFAGFAPSRSPRIAISVLLANDVRYWRKANEVGRDVIEAWLRGAAPG